MKESQAQDLADRFRRAAARHAGVEELMGDDAKDFVFIADRPKLLGSFKVTAEAAQPFFVTLVCGLKRQDNFQLFVMERRKASPMLGTSTHQGTHLIWRYNPTKQSGENAQRKAEFARLAESDRIIVPLPDDDIQPFAPEIVRALALRHQADSVGGSAGPQPDEVPEDDDPSDGPAYWKIAPGEGGGEWIRCRDNQVIVIGWRELGDLTGIDGAEFERRARAAKLEFERGGGVTQAWKFRNIRVGDRVVANAGTRRVLGIGTVTGPYQYVPGGYLPHQLPVHWDDVDARVVDMPGWRRALIRLTESAFAALQQAPLERVTPEAPTPVAAPSGGVDFDGVLSELQSRSLSFPAELVASYLLALQTRRFVLLTGISGTGKTRLAIEVARLFSPRMTGETEAVEIVLGPDMLKRCRFVVPADLAREFDALTSDDRRIDLRFLDRPTESMSLYKDPARPGLLMVRLKGECGRVFRGLSDGSRLALQRAVVGSKEVLVVDLPKGAAPAVPTYAVIAVRPDWTDSRALLGFYNPLTRVYASTPVLNLIRRAREEVAVAATESRAPRPFFLVFDEMNLARVEHYFSDFLSAMESGEDVHLHDDEDGDEDVPQRIALPPNLFVVGTVNVDETTYMFSPKVLDRAFVLEFNHVDLSLLSGKATSEDPTSTPLALSRWSNGLQLLGPATDAEWSRFEGLSAGRLRNLLGSVHAALAEHNRHFGYRVAREIARFVGLAADQTDGGDAAVLAALDVAVVAKVLPKLNGTQAELDRSLRALFTVATGIESIGADEIDSWSVAAEGILGPGRAGALLPRTALKLWRMRKRLRDQGFVSFIE